MLRGELFENVDSGGTRLGLAAARGRLEIQFVEKNFRKLARRIDVEFRTGKLPDLFFEAANFLFHRLRHFVELFRVYAYADALHIREHGRERKVNFFIDAIEL